MVIFHSYVSLPEGKWGDRTLENFKCQTCQQENTPESDCCITNMFWLVVSTPPNIWKHKIHVPNHQPVFEYGLDCSRAK